MVTNPAVGVPGSQGAKKMFCTKRAHWIFMHMRRPPIMEEKF